LPVFLNGDSSGLDGLEGLLVGFRELERQEMKAFIMFRVVCLGSFSWEISSLGLLEEGFSLARVEPPSVSVWFLDYILRLTFFVNWLRCCWSVMVDSHPRREPKPSQGTNPINHCHTGKGRKEGSVFCHLSETNAKGEKMRKERERPS